MAESEGLPSASLPTVPLLDAVTSRKPIGVAAVMLGGVVAGLVLLVGTLGSVVVVGDAGLFGRLATALPIWLGVTIVVARLGVRLGRRRTVAAIAFEPDRAGFVPVEGPTEWHALDSMEWRLMLPSGRRRDATPWHLLVRHRGRWLGRHLSLVFSPNPVAAAQLLRESEPNLEIIGDTACLDRCS